tara:strand:+ start:170 stop:646 length:477 start_codon:yes stop_codon:yes gene_type:complete
MSILTYINEVPLYTNIDEALKWAKYNNIIEATGLGYHVHKYKSITGYMGGKNHSSIPLNPINPPIKPKTKAGYLPPINSTVITVVNGVITATTTTTPTSVYDANGFPKNDKQVVDGVVSRPEITTTTRPTPETGGETDANTSGEGQSRGSGGGGGGGY